MSLAVVRFSLLLVSGAFFFLVFSMPLRAQEVLGDFVVSPGKIELALSPGESRTVELTIMNRTGETRAFYFETENVGGSKDASRAALLLGDDRGPYTLTDYISVSEAPLILEHGVRAVVPVTVTIPPDAEPGGKYGSVLVSTAAPATEVSGAHSAVVSRIGTLFFVTVRGETTHEGLLQDFSLIPQSTVRTSGPVTFSLLFENTGSVHLNPYGEIRVFNMFGEEVQFIDLEPWYVLPESLRLREVTWDREFLFGRYVAVAQVNRGYEDVVDTKEIVFWVVPWKLLIVLVLPLFLVVLGIRLIIKKFGSRHGA